MKGALIHEIFYPVGLYWTQVAWWDFFLFCLSRNWSADSISDWLTGLIKTVATPTCHGPSILSKTSRPSHLLLTLFCINVCYLWVVDWISSRCLAGHFSCQSAARNENLSAPRSHLPLISHPWISINIAFIYCNAFGISCLFSFIVFRFLFSPPSLFFNTGWLNKPGSVYHPTFANASPKLRCLQTWHPTPHPPLTSIAIIVLMARQGACLGERLGGGDCDMGRREPLFHTKKERNL